MANKQDLELVALMARIGRENRDLYRVLRAEAWQTVQANHAQHTVAQREIWLRNAS